MKLPRARCPACGAEVALRKGTLLREHPDHRHELYGVGGAVREGKVPNCIGSGFAVGSQPGLIVGDQLELPAAERTGAVA